MEPLSVPGTLESLPVIREYVLAAAGAAGLDRRTSYRLSLAVDEIATNIVLYGHGGRCGAGRLEVRAHTDPRSLTISLDDQGEAFDPRQVSSPSNLEAPLEERPLGGLGVFLALRSVDEFRYERVGRRNRSSFIMYRPAGGPPAPAAPTGGAPR
jgi:serine/threonine-protein kinase RsbW